LVTILLHFGWAAFNLNLAESNMLNQLENLTERVGGCNKLVDRWLHVRKHLLVAYYNLVGIKPGKE